MSAEKARVLHDAQQQTQTQQQQTKVHVHKKKWVSTGEKALYTLVSSLAIAASVFIVSYSSSLDSMNRDIQKLEGNISDQKVVNENLQFKIKELSDPERILKIAKKNGLKIHQSKVKQADTVSGS
ncbi:cell division protein FtsL [Pontibacillus sp. HMF3514]|uniref:cell division protein FtsL n=1 Tax=Pontibacillus sp. HMF3514 TaxID=2692425 RepID=UPI00131FFBF5|nr:cell division protein FtsL [Pontibacillus sp. HMF3514]QHE52095.1 cell division protein FtsL [Pontibacillus sp. HMF3514]